jgi:hypothetical protein
MVSDVRVPNINRDPLVAPQPIGAEQTQAVFGIARRRADQVNVGLNQTEDFVGIARREKAHGNLLGFIDFPFHAQRHGIAFAGHRGHPRTEARTIEEMQRLRRDKRLVGLGKFRVFRRKEIGHQDDDV